VSLFRNSPKPSYQALKRISESKDTGNLLIPSAVLVLKFALRSISGAANFKTTTLGELFWCYRLISLKQTLPGNCATPQKEAPMTDPELLRLRDSIDNIDAALIHLLAERFKCTQAVGEYKATHNLPPADPGREAAQIARLRQLASDAKLDPDFAEKFLNFIVKEVIRHHEAIAKSRA